MDAFEQAEAEEAERQRRAFLAATYGVDSQRARERLSIGGSSTPAAGSPGTPGNSKTRRQSLLLWERVHMATLSAKLATEAGEGPLSLLAIHLPNTLDESASRRGSLPIAIPGRQLGRMPSGRMRSADMDAVSKVPNPEGETPSEEDESDNDDKDEPATEVSEALCHNAYGRTIRYKLPCDLFLP